jgi:hydroxymethylbilane synthase
MKLGTRGSALALWQTRTTATLIEGAGGPACEIVVIRTSGDSGASSLNVKRTFVAEIEDALAAGTIDAAVHSGKDLPADLPEGLAIGCVLAREDPSDALVMPSGVHATSLDDVRARLGRRPRIGTSSVRRAAQVLSVWPDAEVVAIRGNVDTRLRKLDGGECQALVLAAAGLIRLGLEARISVRVPLDSWVPAPCQGIVAVEVRAGAGGVHPGVAAIDDADARTAFIAERAVVAALGGHCRMPLGVLARVDGQEIEITAQVWSLDGARVIRARLRGRRGSAAALGERIASTLVAQGAATMLPPPDPK